MTDWKNTYTKIVITCLKDGPCGHVDADIWCIRGENGHICPYLQLGVMD